MQTGNNIGDEMVSDVILTSALTESWVSIAHMHPGAVTPKSSRGLCVATAAFFHRIQVYWGDLVFFEDLRAPGLPSSYNPRACSPPVDVWLAAVWTSMLNMLGALSTVDSCISTLKIADVH